MLFHPLSRRVEQGGLPGERGILQALSLWSSEQPL
jgi:hypothetical protein